MFDLLSGYVQAGRRFGTVVLDPPAFAKTRSAAEGAVRGYRDINYRALRLLGHGRDSRHLLLLLPFQREHASGDGRRGRSGRGKDSSGAWSGGFRLRITRYCSPYRRRCT